MKSTERVQMKVDCAYSLKLLESVKLPYGLSLSNGSEIRSQGTWKRRD